MHRVQAMEALGNPDYVSRLSMEGFHRLLLKAGYSEKIAHEEAMKHAWDRLSAGEKI